MRIEHAGIPHEAGGGVRGGETDFLIEVTLLVVWRPFERGSKGLGLLPIRVFLRGADIGGHSQRVHAWMRIRDPVDVAAVTPERRADAKSENIVDDWPAGGGTEAEAVGSAL